MVDLLVANSFGIDESDYPLSIFWIILSCLYRITRSLGGLGLGTFCIHKFKQI